MKTYKALIIDDEHFAQQGLKKIIQHALPDFFMSIDTASSVKEGVEIIKQIKPDIVFLDIQMPDEFGFKLFDCIKRYRSSLLLNFALLIMISALSKSDLFNIL